MGEKYYSGSKPLFTGHSDTFMKGFFWKRNLTRSEFGDVYQELHEMKRDLGCMIYFDRDTQFGGKYYDRSKEMKYRKRGNGHK